MEPNSPAAVAVAALNSAVDTYCFITQMGDARTFMLETVRKMAADERLLGEMLRHELLNPDLTPKHRPVPTAVYSVLLCVAYATDSLKASTNGKASDWAAASEAMYWCGVAAGSSHELIARHRFVHSAQKVEPATKGRRRIGDTTKDKIRAAAAKHPGRVKADAAPDIAREVNLSVEYVRQLLSKVLPGESL